MVNKNYVAINNLALKIYKIYMETNGDNKYTITDVGTANGRQ